MAYRAIVLFACIAALFTTPALASWREASPLVDGACSTGSVNADGIIVSLVMDRDTSADLVIALTGQRGEMFVVNFSSGEDKVFRAQYDHSISFDLTDELISAFRESNSFRLYKSGSGFIGSAFSLSGSSRALDTLYACVGSVQASEEAADASQAVSSVKPRPQPTHEKGATTKTTQLGRTEDCSGFYVYFDTSGGSPWGLSVEVDSNSVDLRFSDFDSIFGRAQIQSDRSIIFNEGQGDPMWTISCYANGALLQKPADQWSGGRTYSLKRASTDIFEYAASKGFDLTH